MKNKGFCVIRTKKDNVVNVYSIATLDFIENNKNRYDYSKSYLCDSYRVLENVGGAIIVELFRKMKYSGVGIETTLKFENGIVESIKIEDYIC